MGKLRLSQGEQGIGKPDETKVRKSDSKQADSPESDAMATSGSTRRAWSVVVHCISTRLFFSSGRRRRAEKRRNCSLAARLQSLFGVTQPRATRRSGHLLKPHRKPSTPRGISLHKACWTYSDLKPIWRWEPCSQKRNELSLVDITNVNKLLLHLDADLQSLENEKSGSESKDKSKR